jgi:hypothetical protein
MPELREVAEQYDREAWRARGRAKTEHLRAMAASLRYINGNRDAVHPDHLRLHYALRVDLPTRWCRRRGYAATLGYDGIYFQRDDEPAQIAAVGDTLHWDGRRISVERGP